jgi:hypothetical protein
LHNHFQKLKELLTMSTTPSLSLEASRNPPLRSSEQTLEGARRVASQSPLSTYREGTPFDSTDESSSRESNTKFAKRVVVVQPFQHAKLTALSLQIIDGRFTDGGKMPTHRPKAEYNIPLGADLCVIGHRI